MPTNRRRNLIRLHKDIITNKKESNNDNKVTQTGKGSRTRTISGEALKSQFKNGNMPNN